MSHFGTTDELTYDTLSRSTSVITEPHRAAHEGFMFHSSGKITGLADAGVQDILLVTAANNYPHLQRMRFDLGKGDVDIVSYEGTVTSNDGASALIRNTNRNSSNTADLTAFTGPTVTDVGIPLHTTWVPPTGTGLGQSANGVSDVANGEEWILKPSTKYLVRLTNNSGSTIDLRFELLFYELNF